MRTISGLVLLSVSLLHGAVLHVGPGRTYTQLSQTVNLVNPGDTVLVDGNQTYTGGVTFTRPGTAERPIVILGVRVNGKRPVLSGGTNTITFASTQSPSRGADYYILQGFEITGGTFRGIFHQAGNLTVRDVTVHDCPAHGILGADVGAGSCTLEWVEVYNCGNGASQHQIYMSTDQVNRPGSVFRMQYCYLHDAKGGNNVKSRAERNEIYYNWIEGAYYHELELIGPDPDGVDDGWTIGLKREDSDVVGNVLRKRRTAAGNDSNFSVTRIGGDATGWTHGRYRFVNNTIIAGSSAVFRCFDTLQTLEAYNNVFFRVGGGTLNMMRTVEAAWSAGTPVIAGSNNWIPQGAQNVPAQWTGTITGTNPGFADVSSGSFFPAAGSPLINAGTASAPARNDTFAFPSPLYPPAFVPVRYPIDSVSNVRVTNGVIDIGAFEAGGASVLKPLRAVLPAATDAHHEVATFFDLFGRALPRPATSAGILVHSHDGMRALRLIIR